MQKVKRGGSLAANDGGGGSPFQEFQERKLRGSLAILAGQEGFGEGDVEIVAAIEILQGVAFIFSEVANLDEVIDDVADIKSTMQTPLMQDGEGHRAELLDDMLAEAFQQFLARDMLIFLSLSEDFGSMVQCNTDEVVGLWAVAGVTLYGAMNGLGKEGGHLGGGGSMAGVNVAQSSGGSMKEARNLEGGHFLLSLGAVCSLVGASNADSLIAHAS